MSLDIFENEGTSEKRCIEIEASLHTLDWDFKKTPSTLYTYVSAMILQNGAKFRYAKAGFKI